MATLVHDDLIDGAASAAAGRRPGASTARTPPGPPATTSSPAPSPSSPTTGDVERRRACSPTPPSRSPAARRCSAASATTPTRRSRPTSSAARSRRGSSSRRPASLGGGSGEFGRRPRHRLPDRRRHPRLRRRDDRDGQGRRHRPARRHADAAAAARRAGRPGRARRARGRPAGGRARARRGDRRARAVPGGGPRLRYGGRRASLDGAPRRRRARGATRTPSSERRTLIMAVLDRTSTLEPIREKVEAGERLDFEDGLALLESDDLLGLGELADLARRAARRHGRGLLRPEPLPEPDERLPREVQVLRLRRDAEAGARLHDHGRGARRGRRRASAS